MKNNDEKIFIFVKGRMGRYAYRITTGDYVEISSEIKEEILENGKEKWQMDCDADAIIDSLMYVLDNTGKDGIPCTPIVHIITTYELLSQIASGEKKSKRLHKFKTNLESIRNKFRQNGTAISDRVKIIWLPNNFQNQMEHVDQLLDANKNKPRP